jgi:hypothetical protein
MADKEDGDDFPYKKGDREAIWNNCQILDLVQPVTVTKSMSKWRSIPHGYKLISPSFMVPAASYEKTDVLTDLFTERARMRAHRKDAMSPLEYYSKHKDRIRTTAPGDEEARELIWKETAECTNFKIGLTKAVVKYFRATSVLDPSAGWGDRLIGTASAGVKYLGVDPNTSIPYGDIISGLNLDPAKYQVIRDGFLEAEVEGLFDLVFTSPPFYDYEIYSDDDKQSIRGTANLQSWKLLFFHPYLKKAFALLSPGGHMVIYISDTKDKYCDSMVKFMATLRGCKFIGVMSTFTDLKKGWPLWVWQKAE